MGKSSKKSGKQSKKQLQKKIQAILKDANAIYCIVATLLS